MHELGYGYGHEPILLNAVILLLVAIVFNGLFRWRFMNWQPDGVWRPANFLLIS